MPRDRSCPICGLTAITRDTTQGFDGMGFDCTRCGSFEMSRPVAMGFANVPDETRARLSCCTRQRTASGEVLRLLSSNWESLAEGYGRLGLQPQRQRILESVARGVEFRPARRHRISAEVDFPLFDCLAENELTWLISSLLKDNLLEGENGDFQLTLKGWETVSPIGGLGTAGLGFVAMSFDAALNEAYDRGIRAAIEDDCNLTAYRVDRQPHNDKIDDRILAGIRRAQFVVADFTLQRPGVYFEAGFGLALGRIVIWTCRDDDFGNLHFDTRQYNHIKWSTPEDLRAKLADRIRATVQLQTRS